MRIGKHFCNIINRATRHTSCFQLVDHLNTIQLGNDIAKHRIKPVAVFDAGFITGKIIIIRQRWNPKRRCQTDELFVITAGDNDKSILGLINSVGNNTWMAVAHPIRAYFGIQPICRLVCQHRNLAIKKRAINMLANTGTAAIGQGCKGCIGGKHSGE